MPAGAPPEAVASVLVNKGILRRLTEFWWPSPSMQSDRLEHRVIDAAGSREPLLHVPHSGPLLHNGICGTSPARDVTLVPRGWRWHRDDPPRDSASLG